MPAGSTASIVFIGFMGAGKSTAARAAAGVLGAEYIDTDELVAERIPGGSIAGFFREQGEARFREIEQGVVLEALERPNAVVALGGGAIESERIRSALSGQVTAWCRVEEEVAWERCAGTDRPLARDRESFRRRHRARESLYEACGRVVLPTGGADLGAVVAPWLELLRAEPDVRMYWATTPSGRSVDYPALIGAGAARVFDRVDPELRPGVRLFGMADRDAYAATGELMPAIEGAEPIPVRGGEDAKSLPAAEALLEELAQAGARREDALLAFGGGVAGDIVGFCAAVYQRGLPVVQVPTTLVAQVDSAYGGKTGVDLPEGKNYVGSFHQPAAVLTDPRALSTLPAVELSAGFAEVVKTALIAGGSLWDRVRSIERLDAETAGSLVFECARTKLDIVAADERENGLRAVLNLGHTVGHGIEAASGYSRYRHGEAIAIGLMAALRLSGSDELRAEVGALLGMAGLPVALDAAIGVGEVLDAIGRDKKRTAEGIGFVLIEAPGRVGFGRPVDADSLRRAVEELRSS